MRRTNFIPNANTVTVTGPGVVIPKSTRYNEGKLKWSLIDYKSMEPLIRIMEKGVEEYGLDNWKIGLDLVEIQESAQRHLASMMNGELRDTKSLELHAGHIIANMMMWIHHYNKQQESESRISK